MQGCAIVCAILLFFRLRTQVANSDVLVNVNVADVVVFVALSVIVLMVATGRIRSLFPPFVTVALAVLSTVIAIGLLSPYAQSNLGNWAIYTRGVGWVLMLGYSALGAAMVNVAGNEGRILILRALIIAAATICVLELLKLAWSIFVFPLPGYVLVIPLQGFANNQNAFCFELAVTGILLVVGRNLGLYKEKRWLYLAVAAVLATTIFFTASRTGAVFVAILALLDNLFTRKSAGDCTEPSPRITLLTAMAIAAVIALAYVVNPASLVQSDEASRLLHPTADIERWETIAGGLRLWLDRPLFGAGIGAYVESLRHAGLKMQGIHSVYIWFLAEMGLVGLAAAVGAGAFIAVKAWRMMGLRASRPWGLAIIGVLSFMALGGIVQDFFYQRIFWFVLGLAAATTGAENLKETWNDRTFLAVIISFGLIVFVVAI